jgi:exodeoxyribonuclease V beta subunit
VSNADSATAATTADAPGEATTGNAAPNGTPGEAERFDPARAPVRPGRALIEASAGTGKTFVLVALFLRLVLEGKEADRLLVVTFTVAATEELTRRIREGLRAAQAVFEGAPCPQPALADLLARYEEHFAATEAERRQCVERLHAARADAGDLAVFTIHGFCKHALEEWAFESGTAFQIAFAEGADDLLRRAAADCWHRRVAGDRLLAEAAVAMTWSIEDLLAHLDKTQRHPDTTVVPAVALDAALAELEEALEALREAWDVDEMRERVAPFVWKKNAPVAAETLPRRVREVAAFADGRLGRGLEAVRALGADQLREHANKRQTDSTLLGEVEESDGPLACAEAVRALDRLERAFVRWFVAEVPGRFRTLKRRRRVMTFDDLLVELLRALEDPDRGEALAAAVRARYDLALVDEFQDTDPRQYGIFRKIFSPEREEATEEEDAPAPPQAEASGEKPVFLIGDAKQAIYRFRGADLYTYLDARAEAHRRFTLEKNWRSHTRLVEAVNAVFEQAPAPFLHADIPFAPVEAAGQPDDAPLTGDGKAPFVWWYHPPGESRRGRKKAAPKKKACPRITQATAGEIVRLLDGGMTLGGRALRASDIAVLVRSNRQGKAMQEALQAAGVPAVVSARRSILETRELAEIETLLRAVLDPQPGPIRAALATEMWGETAREIFEIKEDAERWAALVRQFDEWQRDWQQHGVAYLLTRFLDAQDVRARLLSFHDGERRLTNVRHCVELLHEAEQRRQQAPSGLLRWLARRDEANILEGEETELRLESDERAVQVLTLHKSKGLEFNVVFCPFLWHTYFDEKQHPLVQKEGEGVVYDIGSEERDRHLDLARAEDLAEELRLAYVGLTRAVHRCYAVWGDLRSAPDSALGYLLYAAAADLSEAATPAERAEAVRKVARRAQLETTQPDRLNRLFGDCEHIDVEHVEEVEHAGGVQASLGEGPPAALEARASAGIAARLAPWSYASYSAWTSEAHPQERPQQQAPSAENETEPEGRFAFAAGLRAGRCLHEILERIDFTAAPDAEDNARWVRRLLRRHRLDTPAHHRAPIDPEGVVMDLLGALRTAPLEDKDENRFTFADVDWKARADEWAFSLPVRQAGPRALRSAFAQGGPLAQKYAPRLDALDAADVSGFLRGAADLVFERNGAYYLVDWKSNLLADDLGGYDAPSLKEAMLDHHYVLQYHLYAAALQRHLRCRLKNYDYAEHFGGVCYVFLRGLQRGEPTGVFFDRPAEDLLAALDRTLDGR